MAHLPTLFSAVQVSELQFRQQKCQFAYQDHTMVCLDISKYGISSLKECTMMVLNLKEAKTMREYQGLIGMFGYY